MDPPAAGSWAATLCCASRRPRPGRLDRASSQDQASRGALSLGGNGPSLDLAVWAGQALKTRPSGARQPRGALNLSGSGPSLSRPGLLLGKIRGPEAAPGTRGTRSPPLNAFRAAMSGPRFYGLLVAWYEHSRRHRSATTLTERCSVAGWPLCCRATKSRPTASCDAVSARARGR